MDSCREKEFPCLSREAAGPSSLFEHGGGAFGGEEAETSAIKQEVQRKKNDRDAKNNRKRGNLCSLSPFVTSVAKGYSG